MEILNKTTNGSVTISEDALATIITNAAKDVDGVTGFSNKPADVVSTIKSGSLKVASPVRITQDADGMKIYVYININPASKIQPVAERVQKVVKEAVENMTGEKVMKVNVIIASISAPEAEKTEDAPTESED